MDYIKKANNYSSGLINRNIYLYLYNLIKYIFLNTKKSQVIERKLVEHTDKINEKIIKDKSKFINIKNNVYNKTNFMNILDFIKMQNLIYAGDIIEGILIMTFSFAFETGSDNSFGKYLFINLSKIMDPKNNDLGTWFKRKDKFRNKEEFGNINDLITYDINTENGIDPKIKNKAISFQNKSVFYNLLLEIYKMKYSSFSYNKNNSKSSCYIHRGNFDIQERMDKIYNELILQENKNNDTSDKNFLINSMSKNVSFASTEKKEKKDEIIPAPVRLIKAFFTSVYIYYQNKNSLLMELLKPYNSEKNNENDLANEINISNKGSKNNKNIQDNKDNEDNKDNKDNKVNNNDDDFYYKDPIPFEYDLKGACIEGINSNIILSPIRIEPRVSRIGIAENNLRECGFYDISKTLLFNHNISFIDLNKCLLKSFCLDYFNFGLGVFDNYSIEELNLSSNYIKEDCEEYLARMLSHLKGLKTLILSSNDLKGGMPFFFILLKRLYREGKTNLENLYLNKCILDDASFYELGELLKSKYCKLKILSLSQNNKPSNINFLKKIKKNKTLIEFNFSRNNIGNYDTEDINRIISNTVINHLYLFKNKITSCDDFIKILYRTKLIKDKNETDDIERNISDDKKEDESDIQKEKEDENDIQKEKKDDKINFEIDDNVMIDDNSMLMNLDLSNNDIWTKSLDQVKLIKKIIEGTNLSCLDISHILFGANPDRIIRTKDDHDYINYIYDNIKKPLEDNLSEYKANFKNKKSVEYEIKNRKVDYEMINAFDKELEEFKELKEEINKIIEQKEAQFILFLKEKATEITEKIYNEQNIKEEYKNIVNKENIVSEEDVKKFNQKLVDYMKLKECQKRFLELYKKIKCKKLIII